MGQVLRAEAADVDERYGVHLDTSAALMRLADTDRILMSRAVFDSARQVLRGDKLAWLNHGSYLLKGIDEPIEVCEVASAEKGLTPPSNSAVGQRKIGSDEEPVLGWRSALGKMVPNTPWLLEKDLG